MRRVPEEKGGHEPTRPWPRVKAETKPQGVTSECRKGGLSAAREAAWVTREKRWRLSDAREAVASECRKEAVASECRERSGGV